MNWRGHRLLHARRLLFIVSSLELDKFLSFKSNFTYRTHSVLGKKSVFFLKMVSKSWWYIHKLSTEIKK